MNLKLKEKGHRNTRTKSVNLTHDSADFLEAYSSAQNCSASNIVDQLIQEFKRKLK